MKPAINISKITPPRLHRIIDRPRLFEHLEENGDKNVILILGQAAQGKSTLAASYIQNSQSSSAWINLRTDDSDPVNLFFAMVHALQYAFGGTDLSSLLAYPSINMGRRLERPLYRQWANAIFECISEPVQIVLDGLDNLSPDAPSFGFIQVMLKEMPRHFHFLMLSRHEPDLYIEDLKVKREAHVLANSELAFTLKEVRDFFKEMRGMSLSSDQLRRIHTFTEGWIGGLILLSETLGRLPEEERERFISEDIPDQYKREVFQYFGQEILASQPAVVQEFLIKTSYFEEIVPAFMKDLFGMENIEAILQELVKKNLFTEARFQKEKGWQFQYHPLFKGFLKERFKSKTGKRERRSLLLAAGLLHEQREEQEESIKCYLEANAFDKAASVIERIGMRLLCMGRKGDLTQWLQAFPENMIRDNPWLLLFLSMTRRYVNAKKSLNGLRRCLELFELDQNVRGTILSLAALIDTSLISGRDTVPFDDLLSKGENLVNSKESEPYPNEKAALLFRMGFALTIRSKDQRKAYWYCRDAHMLAKTEGNLVLQANALMFASQALTFLGEFSAAEEEFGRVERLIKQCPYPELRSMYFICELSLWIFQGEVEKALETLTRAKEEVGKHGLVYLYPYTLMYEIMLQIIMRKFVDVEQTGKRLLGLASSMDSLFLQGAATGLLGISYYHNEAWEKAEGFLSKACRIFSSNEVHSGYHLLTFKIVKGLISIHLGKIQKAKPKLRKALDDLSRLNNPLFKVHAHFAMALVEWKQGEEEEASRHLDEAFHIAEAGGYGYFWFINTGDLVKSCVLAIELEASQALPYASQLLSTTLATAAGVELERLCRHAKAGIRKKAREIQRNIHRAQMPPIRIRTLGGFKVHRDTEPFNEKEWKGTQPKALLKSIITHGSKKVPTERVMEDIWPEEAPGEKRMKVVLHRLRKSLEPQMKQTFGSSYVHLKENRLILDEDLCEVDADRFKSLIEEGERKEEDGDRKGTLSLYVEAGKLYKGDFLPEDLYTPAIEQKRGELRRMFLDLLFRMARMYEERGATNRAISLYHRAIQTDPFLEEAYQRLMVLYYDKGKRNKALRVYEDCKKALRKSLDTEPDRVTTAVYQKILES